VVSVSKTKYIYLSDFKYLKITIFYIKSKSI